MKPLLILLFFIVAGCSSDESGDGKNINAVINSAPVIEGESKQVANELEEFVFQPNISDAEDDSLIISIENLPHWASFDESTAEIKGIPAKHDAGEYEHIKINVSDSITTSKFELTITVHDTLLISGKVISGYISGATVYLDENLNGQFDDNEVNTQTDESGAYTLRIYDPIIGNISTSPVRVLLAEDAKDLSRGNSDFKTQPVDFGRYPYLYDLDSQGTINDLTISPYTNLVLQQLQQYLYLFKLDEISIEELTKKRNKIIDDNAEFFGTNKDVLYSDYQDQANLEQDKKQQLIATAIDLIKDIQISTSPLLDIDNDGIINSLDAFPYDSNENKDTDYDGIGNNADSDDDNDGFADIEDLFPLNPLESIDSDYDGIGNNADTDDDNDSYNDDDDAFPLDPLEYIDSDIDGIGDNRDTDDDNDGVIDARDLFPFDPSESYDSDLDGKGNNVDDDDDGDGVLDELDTYPLDPFLTTLSSIPTDEVYFSNTTLNTQLEHTWGVKGISDTVIGPYQILLNSVGGLASGDYDNDGDIDLFVLGGDSAASKLYQNNGQGQFIDVAELANVQLMGLYSGPSFADTDNDGDLDLFIGALSGKESLLFINQGNGKFLKKIIFKLSGHVTSSSFADIDKNGTLDLIISRYATEVASTLDYLWLNEGENKFIRYSNESNIDAALINKTIPVDYSFSSSFADINNDLYPDLLIAADFDKSSLLLNDTSTGFIDISTNMNLNRNDLNGMGSAIADYDNDGDLDWFISGILSYDPASGQTKTTGNKLLNNDGSGYFQDVSYNSGVSNGGWAWGSCFADFNHDGHLDLFQTNGWISEYENQKGMVPFTEDEIKLFINNGSGQFNNKNTKAGLTDNGQGRAIVCFDADNDGDIDLLISNNDINNNGLVFYENTNGSSLGNYLKLLLRSDTNNRYAIGALVTIETAGLIQTREVNINSNFISHNPSDLHFGLANNNKIDKITIKWPDGQQQVLTNVLVNQTLSIEKP